MITSLSSTRRVIGIFVALLLASLAQALFTGLPAPLKCSPSLQPTQWIVLALGLVIAAMMVFAWAAPAPADRKGRAPRRMHTRVRWWALALALAVYTLSLVLDLMGGETAMVRWLWLGGMIFIVIAYLEGRPTWRWSHADWQDWLLVVGITAIAFILRYWRLPDLPAYFHGDIASQGLQAISMLEGQSPAWFSVGWSNIPKFDFVMMAATMRLFGQDLFGLAMTAVWQGVLTIPIMYLLGRELFGRRAGLLAATLLAISYTHIHFSRIVTTASPLLFITLVFYFLFRGLRLSRGIWFVLAGLCLGIGLLVYYPIRVAVVVIILLFLWLLLWKRESISYHFSHWLGLGVGALLGFGPMMVLVLQDFQAFGGRGAVVTIWNPAVMDHLLSKYGVNSAGAVWVEQFKRTFLTFFYYPDASTHFAFSGPMVNAFTAVFLALGVGYGLRWLRDERYFTLIVWFVLTLMLGGVITNDPPFWPHIVIVLPAVALLAAAAAERAWRGLVRALPSERRRAGDLALGSLLALALLGAGVHNWRAYVAQMGDNADAGVRVARYIAALPDDHTVALVPDPLDWKQREIAFLGRRLTGSNVSVDAILRNDLPQPSQPTVFILTPNHGDLLPALQRRFPDGVYREHKAESGWLAFDTYLVRPPGYTPSPTTVDPAHTLADRQRLGWLIAAGALGLAAGVGFFLLIKTSSAEARASLSTTMHTLFKRKTGASSADQIEYDEPGSTRDKLLASLAGMTLALALAYLAQRFYDGRMDAILVKALTTALPFAAASSGRLLMGSLLYVAAMVIFALFAPAFPMRRPKRKRRRRLRTFPGRLRPDAAIIRADPEEDVEPLSAVVAAGATPRTRAILLAVALAPSLWALVRFAWLGEDSWVRGLWLVGLAIFVVGQIIWPALRGVTGPNAEYSPPFTWPRVALLIVILAAGFWLRVYRLDAIPNDLHGDMASMGLQAREWLSGAQPNLFREGWANIPMIGFLPAALSLKFFGNDLFALNFSAVVGGVLTLFGLYLLVWRLFDSHRLAALAAGILALNITHIHFSRLAAYMDPWPFIVFALFFVIDGMRARRAHSFALSGVLLAFGFQMYYSGRAVVFILAAALVYLWIVRRRWITNNWGGLGLLLAGAFIALGPSLLYFAGHWEVFVERSRAVFLFYEPVMTHLANKYQASPGLPIILEQIKRSLLMFNYSTDSSTQFGYRHPMFTSMISPLVVLGFGFSLRRWRTPGLGLNLIWLLLLILFGSVLTNNAPFWPRLVGVLPSAALLAALVFDRYWAVLRAGSAFNRSRYVDGLMGLAIAILLLVVVRDSWSQYVRTVENNARPQALIGRYLASLPEDITVCNFAEPYALSVRETAFLAWPRPSLDLPAETPAGALERCADPPVVWIISANHADKLAAIQARWPGGERQGHFDRNGALIFTSYLITDQLPVATAGAPFDSALPTPAPQRSSAFMPDGSPFIPQQTFLGNTGGSVWEITAGPVKISDGELILWVGPVSGHDAVYDYVKLVSDEGVEYRFEAEDTAIVSGDDFSDREGIDGHWWLQNYGPFSNGQGLVIQKQETGPALRTTIQIPNGSYQLYIGSFTGDPDNGVFGLGVRRE